MENIKAFLDFKVDQFNVPSFIEEDPISIPHQFHRREDREISGFLTATISWGQRKAIIKNAQKMMRILGESPYDYVMSVSKAQLERTEFVHRTFQSEDFRYFVRALRHLYANHGGLLPIFETYAVADSLQPAIAAFRTLFFSLDHPARTRKHLSNPQKGSPAKRINMMLRWFVRKDDRGVDLGIWNHRLKPSQLSLPLDVHTANISRKLQILRRSKNDSKAVHEIDSVLRSFDSMDPVKYDFALFGLGAMERF